MRNLHDIALLAICLNIIVALLAFGSVLNIFVADSQTLDGIDYDSVLDSGAGNEEPVEESSYGKAQQESRGILSQLDALMFSLPHFFTQIFGARTATGQVTIIGYAAWLLRGLFSFLYGYFIMEFVRGYRSAG